MRTATTLVLVVMAGCGRETQAAADPHLEARRQAFDTLMNLTALDSAHTGAVGALSNSAVAFRVILAAPDAEARFVELNERAQTAGRLLALCGLKVTGSSHFASALQTFAPQHGELGGMQGCILGLARPITDVLADINGRGLCESYASDGQ